MAYVSEKEHALVTAAVAEAERNTSGEIVTVLADRSDGYTDVILVWAAAIAFSAMSVFAVIPEPFLEFWDSLTGGWGTEWSAGELATVTILLGLIAFALTWTLFSLPSLRYRVVPSPVKAARANDAAIRHFKVGAERRTHGRTGVLLYLSMREHRAEIVADEAIATRVPAEIWGEAMVDMLAEVSRGRIAEGLAAGVRDVGKVLAEHFPREDDDQNELPDRLIEV